jgi:hypothetical protein
MIRLSHPFRALLESLESLGLARKPTTQQVQRACERFVEMVAEIVGMRVEIRIGDTPIARSAWPESITTKSTSTPRDGCATS